MAKEVTIYNGVRAVFSKSDIGKIRYMQNNETEPLFYTINKPTYIWPETIKLLKESILNYLTSVCIISFWICSLKKGKQM